MHRGQRFLLTLGVLFASVSPLFGQAAADPAAVPGVLGTAVETALDRNRPVPDRLQAIEKMRSSVEKSARIRAALTRLLDDPVDPIRGDAALGLDRFAPDEAVPALIRMTEAQNPVLRYAAVKCLMYLGARNPALVERVVKFTVSDTDGLVRNLPRVLARYRPQLFAETEELRRLVDTVCGKLKAGEGTVNEHPAAEQVRAVRELAAMGAGARLALANLRAASVANEHAEVRRTAEEAVARIDPQCPRLDPEVRQAVEQLYSPDPAARLSAIKKLGDLSDTPRTRAVIPALSRLLRGGDQEVINETLLLVRILLPDSKALTPAVDDVNRNNRLPQAVRNRAGMLSRRMATTPDRPREPRPEPQPEPPVGGDPEVLALMAKLTSPDVVTRLVAAKKLGALGPRARDAVGALTELSRSDPDPDVRRVAAAALAKVTGGGGGEVRADPEVAALMEKLKSPDALTRLVAAKKLGNLGPRARSAVAALTQVAQSDPDGDVRRTAASALQLIQGVIVEPPRQPIVGNWSGGFFFRGEEIKNDLTFRANGTIRSLGKSSRGRVLWDDSGKWKLEGGMIHMTFPKQDDVHAELEWNGNDKFVLDPQGYCIPYSRVK